ncbi:MAG: hypothetical protein OXT09_11540 [Myxococcales bacterium]|nr:hypothetical protein [Myxococcales bacterium]
MASDQMAKEQFQQGRQAYNGGNFQQALDAFQRAYQLSPRPELLFNIGQAADRLRMDDLALSSFKQYLAELPQAHNREQVENRVRALEAVIAQRDAREAEAGAAPPPAPAPTPTNVADPVDPVPPPAPPSERPLPLGPLLLGGGGVALVGVGLAFGAMAKSEEDEYAMLEVSDAAQAHSAADTFDSAESKALVSNVLIGAGAAVVTGAVVWWALDGDDEPQVTLAPWLGPAQAGLSVRGALGGRP